LAVLGGGPGDEVILPSFSFMSAFQVIRQLGATPVFADIELGHLTLDPADVERRVTTRTRGIVVVHHGGYPADTGRLQAIADRAGAWLLEDGAHAIGTHPASLCDDGIGLSLSGGRR